MSFTLGKVRIKNWDVSDLEFLRSGITHRFKRNDEGNFMNSEYTELNQSLNDLLVVKLLEVVLGQTELMNPDADMFFIECTHDNPYWVQMIRDGEGYTIEVGEPAA